MLINRQFEIVKFFLQNSDYYTLEYLANKFKVSTRTIINDLNAVEPILTNENISVIHTRKLGIKFKADSIDSETVQRVLSTLQQNDHYSESERINAIICYLLLCDSRFTISMLSESLDVGKNTIIRDLEKCEKWLNEQNIYLKKNKKAGTVLVYDEYSWRMAALNYISKKLSRVDFQKLYQSFDKRVFLISDLYTNKFINYFTENINRFLIKNFIRKYEDAFSVNFTDDSFIKIFFYLCVSMTRIKQKHCLENIDYSAKYVDTKNIEWLRNNKEMLENGLGVKISADESVGILLSFLSQNKYYLEEVQLFDHVDEVEIVNEFINEVSKILCIDIAEDAELKQNLLMHMRPAVNRMKYSMRSENPLTDEIKRKYPQIFNACKKGSYAYEKYFMVAFDDDEVAYMAMHIAASVERNKDKSIYFHKVIVVCSSGIGTSNMIKWRLLTEFPNILIKEICSVKDLQSINNKDVELIISTVPLFGKYEKPVVCVSPLLNGDDIENIEQYVNKTSNTKRRYTNVMVDQIMLMVSQECNIGNYSRLQSKLQKLFNDSEYPKIQKPLSYFLEKDGVNIVNRCDGWQDAVIQAGRMLVENNRISENYIQRLLKVSEDERVNIILGSGVAMPHTAYSKKDVFETSISLLKLNEPVQFPFSKEKIWLVIILAAVKDNAHVDAINEIAGILNEDDLMDRIKDAQSKTELIGLLKKYEMKK